MFISGTSTVPTLSAGMHKLHRAYAHEAYLCCLSFVDSETGREETKVRLWWHEHWQTRYSSKEAEKEVDMPTQTPLLQQVRTKIATLPRNIRSSRPRSKPTENRSRQAARIHPCTLPRLSPPYLKTRRIDVPDDGGWHCWDIREAGGSICSGDIGSAVLEFNPEGRGRAAASNTLCVLVNVMVEQGRHQVTRSLAFPSTMCRPSSDNNA